MLEMGLRTAAFLIMSLREHRNILAMQKTGNYRIMCIGESTTAGQYPVYLEQILNKDNKGVKFSIIDKGMGGSNTIIILNQLESDLDKYKPDMVIAMIGVNDFGPHMPRETIDASRVMVFFRSFRVYKLIRLIWLHIATRAQELGFFRANTKNNSLSTSKPGSIMNKSEESMVDQSDPYLSLMATLEERLKLNLADDQAYLALGHFYQKQDNYLQAAQYFLKAIELNPRNDSAYAGLGWSYQGQVKLSQSFRFFNKAIELNPRNDSAYVGLGGYYLAQAIYSKAEEAYERAIELNPRNDSAYAGMGWCCHSKGEFSQAIELFKKAVGFNPKNYWGIIGLGASYQFLDKYSDAIEIFKKANELNPKDIKSYIGLGTCYLKQKKYTQAEDIMKKATYVFPGNPEPYGLLSILYKEIGQDENAEQCHKKANATRLGDYNPVTVSNYRKIKSILDRRGIKLVCVQYPIRSVEPLKNIFVEEDGVIFVDNESIFKDAVFKDGYNEYFSDMFGGDFGHCREKGNRLLANNIANVISKELFSN